jgi:Bifunctional DNA primase/polymerase, N-terminal/Primase C terminal 1 (PriCT-1)
MTTLDAAFEYASRGLPVFPVYAVSPFRDRFVCFCTKGQRCKDAGKHPMTPHGFKDATTDPATVRYRWATAPNANVAIACSRNCVVLDVDPRHGGDVALDQLEQRHGSLPRTWTAKTGGGGLHYYFQAGEDIRNSAGKVGQGIDIRGAGGYVVAPPSRHISGGSYEWATGRAPTDVALAIMPPWLVAAARSQIRKKAVAAPATAWREFVRNGVSEGERNAAIARLTGYLVRRNIDPWVALELMIAWNAHRCGPPLDEQEVQAIVNSIAASEYERQTGGAHDR